MWDILIRSRQKHRLWIVPSIATVTVLWQFAVFIFIPRVLTDIPRSRSSTEAIYTPHPALLVGSCVVSICTVIVFLRWKKRQTYRHILLSVAVAITIFLSKITPTFQPDHLLYTMLAGLSFILAVGIIVTCIIRKKEKVHRYMLTMTIISVAIALYTLQRVAPIYIG